MRRFVTSWIFAGFVAVGVVSPAAAVPITSYDQPLYFPDGSIFPGTITATLDLYTRPYGDFGSGCCGPTGPATLVQQFSVGLGSDFWVYIPPIADPFSSWEMPIPTGSSGLPGWPVSGLNLLAQTYPGGTDVATLSEWCSPNPAYVDGIFVIARRGTCAFTDKIDNIEAANGVGAIIVNSIPEAGAMAMAVGVTPPFPVISVSYEVGEIMMAALNSTGADNIPDLVYVDFSARWDPKPPDPPITTVPEPGSLALLAVGLAALAIRRRRQGDAFGAQR